MSSWSGNTPGSSAISGSISLSASVLGVAYQMYSKFLRAMPGRHMKSIHFSALALFSALAGMTQESTHTLEPSSGTT